LFSNKLSATAIGAENHAHSNFTLTDEASAAGANGETNGDFPPPADRTRHKQVGNVRAGDDQHQAHDKQHCAYQRQAASPPEKLYLTLRTLRGDSFWR
jgi:hypothetical protein